MPDFTLVYTYQAVVARIVDGDTIVADIDLGFFTWRRGEFLRLSRIDAPEPHTETREAGDASTAFLRSIIPVGTPIVVQTFRDRRDGFRRYIAEIWLGDMNVNDLMVTEGHAIYRTY
jgi:micrococcal nuclease